MNKNNENEGMNLPPLKLNFGVSSKMPLHIVSNSSRPRPIPPPSYHVQMNQKSHINGIKPSIAIAPPKIGAIMKAPRLNNYRKAVLAPLDSYADSIIPDELLRTNEIPTIIEGNIQQDIVEAF